MAAFLRPPPRLRMRTPCSLRTSAGVCFSSDKPSEIARLDTPQVRATSEIPPRPIAALSAAAHNRRVRSSNHGSSCLNRLASSCSLATKTFYTKIVPNATLISLQILSVCARLHCAPTCRVACPARGRAKSDDVTLRDIADSV
jgi:hypothetical protein